MEANMVRNNISSPDLSTMRPPTVDRTTPSAPERTEITPREAPAQRSEPPARSTPPIRSAVSSTTSRSTQPSRPAPSFEAMSTPNVDILSAHPTLTSLSTESLTFGIPFSSNEISEASIAQAIASVNNSLQMSSFSLSHNIHEDTNMVMVQVIDSNTQEVLREIPSESRLDLIARMREFVGILFDVTG
ncbi:MAG: flagellar protein FlaG [Defluviitaleaceae bacterium]|nr:flagellar protein FlaG [Defluviitaleaceae bacterium]